MDQATQLPRRVKFNYRNFSFITPWNVNAGLSVNQVLFEPQVFVGLQSKR